MPGTGWKMRTKRPQPVDRVLANPRSMLAQLKNEADHLRTQQAALHGALPEALRPRCQLARVEDNGELLLVTDTPAAASQLRYLGASLCDRVTGRRGCSPTRVRIRIEPQRAPREGPKQERKLSQTAASHLSAAARHQPNERIRQALLRLASRATPDKKT